MNRNLGVSFMISFAICGFSVAIASTIIAIAKDSAWLMWPLLATVALALYLNATEKFPSSKEDLK